MVEIRTPQCIATLRVALGGFVGFAAIAIILFALSWLQVPYVRGYKIGGTTLFASSQPGTSEWHMDYSMDVGTRWPFVDTTTREITIYKDRAVVSTVDFDKVIKIMLEGKAALAAIDAEHVNFAPHHFDETGEHEWLRIEQMLLGHTLRDVQRDPLGRALNVLHAAMLLAALACFAAFAFLKLRPLAPPPSAPE